MKNEWKELKIDKLPEDILTGDYEFEYNCATHPSWTSYPNNTIDGRLNLLSNIEGRRYCVRYCKPEPKPPTHEEIMKKWWFQGNSWFKVDGYEYGSKKPYIIPNGHWSEVVLVKKSWFTGRESADIPPEA